MIQVLPLLPQGPEAGRGVCRNECQGSETARSLAGERREAAGGLDPAGEILLVSPVEQVQEPLACGSPDVCAWVSLHPTQNRPLSRIAEALPVALG